MPNRTLPAPDDDFHVDLLSHSARHSAQDVMYSDVIVGSQGKFRAPLGDKVYQRSMAGLQTANNASSLLRYARMLGPAFRVHGEFPGIVPQKEHRHTNTYFHRHQLAVIAAHDSCHSPGLSSCMIRRAHGPRAICSDRCIIVALKCMSYCTNSGDARSLRG